VSEFASVTAYVAAREAGDTAECSRIVAEVNARFATRTTDGREITALLRTNLDLADGEDLFAADDQAAGRRL
jgi:hypothetical protein